MTRGPVARLARLTSAHKRWVAAGAVLGFLAIASNVALVAMSAFLVSKAAVVDNVADIALAVTAVRVLAIGRAAFRYLERYATHVATLRILADVRVWVVLDAVVTQALGVLERSLLQRVAAGRAGGARSTERRQRRSCRGEGHSEPGRTHRHPGLPPTRSEDASVVVIGRLDMGAS